MTIYHGNKMMSLLMRHCFLLLFIAFFVPAGFCQSSGNAALVNTLCGVYQGYYLSKSNFSRTSKKIELKPVGSNRIGVDSSAFGKFEFSLNGDIKDTINILSDDTKLTIKIIVSKKRLFINGDINGVSTSFSGKLSYKNQDDLNRQKVAYEALKKDDDEKPKSYGTFYGSLKQNGKDDVMDTLRVSEFKYEHRKGEFQIREKMVKIISYSKAFEPIFTQIDTDIATYKIKDYKNKPLNLMIDQANKVILLEDTTRKLRFEGIQID
ncbi:MAG: hypothetical protein M9911_00970 [Saprospiraceae bacterium]|nr:hypothetical protein [Saprospiraceae bacterium]